MKRTISIIIVLLFLTPTPAAWYIFFHKDININMKVEKTDDDRVLVTVLKDEIQYQFFQDIIARVLQIPLNLTHYNVCFRNKSYSINELGEKNFIIAKDVILEGTDGESLNVKPFDIPIEDIACQEVNLSRFIISGALYIFPISKLPTKLELNFDLAPDGPAHFSTMDKWITAVVFVFAFYGILILIKKAFSIIYSNIKTIFSKNR